MVEYREVWHWKLLTGLIKSELAVGVREAKAPWKFHRLFTSYPVVSVKGFATRAGMQISSRLIKF